MIREIKTPRGTFKGEEFRTDDQARKNGYGFYFTNGDGTEIYTKHSDEYHCTFGFVLKIQNPVVGSIYQLSDGGVYFVAACDKSNPDDYALIRPSDGYMLVAHHAIVDYTKSRNGIISWDFSTHGHFIFN